MTERDRERRENALRRKQEEAKVRSEEQDARRREQDDELSARVKSSGHGKKTADKWNQ